MTTREAKLEAMQKSYSERRDAASDESVVAFHTKHLKLFLNRFGTLARAYGSPTSHLLDHDLFLSIEAASNIAAEDLRKSTAMKNDPNPIAVEAYFTALTELRTGKVDLRKGIEDCLAALEGGVHWQ